MYFLFTVNRISGKKEDSSKNTLDAEAVPYSCQIGPNERGTRHGANLKILMVIDIFLSEFRVEFDLNNDQYCN